MREGDEDRLADLLIRWEELYEMGQDVSAAELCQDCPELEKPLADRIADLKRVAWVTEPQSPALHLYPRAEPLPGYRLIKQIGKGAFGEVWSADCLQEPLPRRFFWRKYKRYALKFISGRPDLAREVARSRLEQEGNARIRHITHPFILRLHRGARLGTTTVLITELAECSLEAHFQRLRGKISPLCVYIRALYLLRDVAEALDDLLSENSLIHLDVKPANLLLVNGRCKLADFGTVRAISSRSHEKGGVILAAPSESDPNRTTTTRYQSCAEVPWERGFRKGATLFTGAGAFTPQFAPPEAFQGKSSRSFDQYSLALTFCELVSGQVPFQGGADTQVEARAEGRMDLTWMLPAIKPVIARALEPRPENRFPSCMEFMEDMWKALRPLLREDKKANRWLSKTLAREARSRPEYAAEWKKWLGAGIASSALLRRVAPRSPSAFRTLGGRVVDLGRLLWPWAKGQRKWGSLMIEITLFFGLVVAMASGPALILDRWLGRLPSPEWGQKATEGAQLMRSFVLSRNPRVGR
jgi:serine/threonine protein kinase